MASDMMTLGTVNPNMQQIVARGEFGLVNAADMWSVCSANLTLAAANDYAIFSYVTPATGDSFLYMPIVAKTGNEVQVSILEGGTLTAGTASTPPNINRNRNATDPFPGTVPLIGTSAGTGTTIATATTILTRIIPGTGTAGNLYRADCGYDVIKLAKGTRYSVQVLSIGVTTNVQYCVDIAYVA